MTVELIADGVHVHPAVVHAVIEAAGSDRVALVTDATADIGFGLLLAVARNIRLTAKTRILVCKKKKKGPKS